MSLSVTLSWKFDLNLFHNGFLEIIYDSVIFFSFKQAHIVCRHTTHPEKKKKLLFYATKSNSEQCTPVLYCTSCTRRRKAKNSIETLLWVFSFHAWQRKRESDQNLKRSITILTFAVSIYLYELSCQLRNYWTLNMNHHEFSFCHNVMF